MKFLAMLDKTELNTLFERFYNQTTAAIEGAFRRHGFRAPHSATSVSHNIMADNTEREKHLKRMENLGVLIASANIAANMMAPSDIRTQLMLAIGSVQKDITEF